MDTRLNGNNNLAGAPRAIERLAALSALLGGALLTAIMLMSVVSIAMRAMKFDPIQGDFELVQVGLAACIALLLPWCQLQGGNIVADFFTSGARKSIRRRLDALGAVLFVIVMALVAWRTAVGAVILKANGETTMILGFPIWIGYALMTPGLVLTAVVAALSALRAWREANNE
jgi:TRAP-type C4-dicarboxylate transport system permease small subunit